MSKAYFARELSADGIIFSDIKVGKFNNKSVWMNYDGGSGNIKEKRLNMQTPVMFNVFGVNDGKFEEGQDLKPQMQLSFGRQETNSMKQFHQFFKEVDDLVINAAMKNSKEWLGMSKLDRALAEAFYTPIVRQAVNSKTGETMLDDEGNPYPDSIRFKINTNKKDDDICISLEVYDNNGGKIPVTSFEDLTDAAPKSGRVRIIFHLASVWLADRSFGVSLRAQLLECTPSTRLKGWAGRDDSETGADSD